MFDLGLSTMSVPRGGSGRPNLHRRGSVRDEALLKRGTLMDWPKCTFADETGALRLTAEIMIANAYGEPGPSAGV